MRFWVALLLLLLPALARAQGDAVLVADTLTVTADEVLVATGNVQAFYEGTVVSAARVTYDRGADRLTIDGPILIRRPDGAVLTASRAELDPRLEDGLLQGARLVLDRRLQLAAARIDRTDGRYTALSEAVVSSCQVCPGRAPIWEIRADRVLHDEAARVLHVENATFRVRGVPILWLPRLRLPDPTNPRETGFLVPSIRTSDTLGVSVRLPLFVELGPSRDLLLAPVLSPLTSTLETRYRQAFLRGDLLVQGAASRDDLAPGTRGYLAAAGAFDLGRGYALTFEGVVVSDDAYLLDYGVSDADRLESTFAVTRVEGRALTRLEVSAYRSLREGEAAASLPPYVAAFAWERRRPLWGGLLTVGTSADAYWRTEGRPGAETRDGTRAGATLGWSGSALRGPGLLIEGEARLALDAWRIADDPASPQAVARAAPAAQATLRWPLVRHDPTGAPGADLVQPVVSLGWSDAAGGSPPNEDGRLLEFDGGNLLALDRLPGQDAVEPGGRLSAGLAWTHAGPGYAATLAAGRLWRTEAFAASDSSGLGGLATDTLLSGRLELPRGIAVNARTLLDGPVGALAVGKTEARLDWDSARVALGAAYLYLPADPGEGRAETAAEWQMETTLRPSPRWTVGLDARYDVGRDQPARAGVSLGWRNECVEVDVSLARRYTSTDTVEPSTDFGLSVNLTGFSAGGEAVAPGACRG